ncbi:MAG: hypothetical protein RLZZ359_600 [Actinomycetota bacterium]|jgi:tRNA threonylcarbamoyl adenosine modification protein YeaZ
MLILAIDTSAGTSVAVLRGQDVLAEVTHTEGQKHAEQIGSTIADAIAQARVAPADIKAVALGRGPALFTGLRVGMAAAIMFAEGVGAKTFGVVSLDALALTAFSSGANATAQSPILITTDARRGEVYYAAYSGLDAFGAPIAIEGPGVMKPAELDDHLANRNLAPIRFVGGQDVAVSAAALGQVFAAHQAGGNANQDITALYLREADAVAPVSNRLAGKKVSS